MENKAKEKKERLIAALDQGMVMIHLDARRPGVLVPAQLRTESHLRLNLSYRFDPPDLSVNDWGVRSSLSFSGSRFTVAVPWSALFAVTSYVTKEFWIYPDELPPELIEASLVTERVDIEQLTRPAAPAPEPRPALAGRALLRDVSGDKQESLPLAPPPPPPQDEPPPGPKPRGHLRVVK